MIQINGKDVSQIRVGNKIVTAVYIGAKLVWQSIRSCFGSGFWINSSPWKMMKAGKTNKFFKLRFTKNN